MGRVVLSQWCPNIEMNYRILRGSRGFAPVAYLPINDRQDFFADIRFYCLDIEEEVDESDIIITGDASMESLARHGCILIRPYFVSNSVL